MSTRPPFAGWVRILPLPIRRIYDIAREPGKRSILALVVLSAGVAILEFISIGSFFPLLLVLFDPAALDAGRAGFPAWAGGVSRNIMISRLAAGCVALLVIKTVFTAWALRRGFRFAYDVEIRIGHRILQRLLSRSYEFHVNRNAALLLKNVTTEVHLYATNVLLPSISLLVNSAVILGLIVLLLWLSPVTGFAILCLVAVITAGTYAVTRRSLRERGRLREVQLGKLHRLVDEALRGVKTVRAYSAEAEVLQRYATTGRTYAELNSSYQGVASLPPLLLELFMFAAFALLALVYTASGDQMNSALPLIGIAGAASFRILPASRRVFNDLVTIQYYWSSVETLERELAPGNDDVFSVSPAPSTSTPLLRASLSLRDVSYAYPDGRSVLSHLSLDIAAGSRVAVVGRSGAGKSTLVDVMLGLLRPQDGAVFVDGVRLSAADMYGWLAQVGYVSQQVFMVDDTIRANIAFGIADDDVDDDRITTVLRQAQLLTFVSELSQGVYTSVGDNAVRLSGGQRQRLAIARALYRNPRLLVLDEATSALDSATEAEVVRDVIDGCPGVTMVIVAHRETTVQACDRILVLEDGAIVADGDFASMPSVLTNVDLQPHATRVPRH